jgi:hypothetical protein
MPRIGLVIEDELHEVISQEAEKTHILPSELMRMALREFFSNRGYTLTEKVKLGGKRKGSGRPKTTQKEGIEI